jgi:pteridine reductase
MELKGRVALVTGAGKRVGRAIAVALAERGATAAIHYRSSKTEAEAAVAEIEEHGAKARCFRADLEQVSEIEQLISDVLEAFGRIDVLVNSASIFYRKPLAELTEQDWDVNLNTNLKAPFFISKFAGAAMRRQGRGKIVNIGDWAGIRPYNNYLPYTVSKSGLIGLTRALAKALAPEVQVNLVALGPVMPPDDYDTAEIEQLRQGTLTKTLGTPDDVARAVVFLCESADFTTGATLMVDGGRLLN